MQKSQFIRKTLPSGGIHVICFLGKCKIGGLVKRDNRHLNIIPEQAGGLRRVERNRVFFSSPLICRHIKTGNPLRMKPFFFDIDPVSYRRGNWKEIGSKPGAAEQVYPLTVHGDKELPARNNQQQIFRYQRGGQTGTKRFIRDRECYFFNEAFTASRIPLIKEGESGPQKRLAISMASFIATSGGTSLW